MPGFSLAAATGDAVAIVAGLPDHPEISLSLEGSGAQCVAADPDDGGRVFVGTFDQGVFATNDAGRSWRDAGAGIPHKRVLAVAVSPCDRENDTFVAYAGTEPSSLYRTGDDGKTWEDLASLRDLPSAPTWSFPPRPETHHVRWIAPHQTKPEALLVAIELGGVMRTLDGGRTWQDRHVDAVIDPHVIRTHAVATDRAYAVGGDGISFSADTGESWQRSFEGLDRPYCWGLAVDPEDPELWYVSAAPDPFRAHGDGDARARLFRKWRSAAWEPLELDDLGGVDAPLTQMPYALVTLPERPGEVMVGMHDGTLLYGQDAGQTWRTLDARLPGILAMDLLAG